MAISVADLKFFQSERMTDNADGGGRMTSVEIVSGVENSIFDDISDVDRATGDVSVRKVYAAVASADTDKYLDAGLAILREPDDENTRVLGLSTGNFFDERAAIADAIQQYRSRGVDTKLRLIGTHYVNQRVLYGYLVEPVNVTPETYFYDAVLSVASESNGTITQEQFVRVMRVRSYSATYVYLVNNVQTTYQVKEVVLDLVDPLQYQFAGSAENPSGGYTPPTVVRTTQVVAPYTFIGIAPIAAQAVAADTVIHVEDTKAAIVPVDYQDLGANVVAYPAATGQIVLDAPNGFTLSHVVAGTVNHIAYRYGDEWIETGEPNAATYIAGSFSFPLRPDTGSKVFVRYLLAGEYTVEQFSNPQGGEGATLSVTSENDPLLRGGLAVACDLKYPGQTWSFGSGWATDDGNGHFSNNYIRGTINYATGAISVTPQAANMLIANASIKLRMANSTQNVSTYAEILPAPVIASTVAVSGNTGDDGATLEATDNGSGVISGDGITGTVDYLSGLLQVTFPEAMVQTSVSVAYRMGGVVPQSAAVLGIDPVRLPKDGRMPIFIDGQLVLIHHTDDIVETNLSPTQVIDCGRIRLYRVAIDDATGKRLPADFYTVNRDAGTVTLSPSLNLTGYSGPYTLHHTVADLCRVNRVSHAEKTLTLARAVSHTYPADEARASSVLWIGTMQARYANLFAQSTWDSVWSDSLRGSEPLAQYDDASFPISVTNESAYTDRILIKFTNATLFQVIGENLGIIADGTINADCAPVNPHTGQPYFTLDHRGWGSGWATGNCLRFNLIGACHPVDLIRSIQPSEPTGLPDSVELMLIGNIDA